jgi:tight adherence protein B
VLTAWCGLMAGALLCWPNRPARTRVAFLAAPARSRSGPKLPSRQPGLAATTAGAALLGWLVAGTGGAVAVALAAMTVITRWRARRRDQRRTAATAELAAGLALFAAELRAGVHPAVAAQRVAGDVGPSVAAVFETVAAAARLSGDVAGSLRRADRGSPVLAEPLDRMAAAWRLAEQHGIGLADVLDAVRRDLDHRVRAARRLTAALAGPRATAFVLAVLPVVGLLLGQAVGADPWQVLTGSVAGQVLLVAGSALVCLGVAWSARLVSRVAVP